ncbi:MAG: anhydro-N-acetylmuramic acid kinase [bacterium]
MKREKSRMGDITAPPKLGRAARGAFEVREEEGPPVEQTRPEKQKPAPRRATAGTLSGYYIGIQSGTSMDGADVALVAISGDSELSDIRLVDYKTFSYPKEMRDDLRLLSHLYALPENTPARKAIDLERMNVHMRLGDFFADSILELMRESGVERENIHAIGSHGQTVWHAPPRLTVQIGAPELIAKRTGIVTIADFRVSDLKEGGQGAPLVPLLDFHLCRHPRNARMLVNIGGICNITYLPAGCEKKDIIGFDVGPGNCLIDRFVFEGFGHSIGYDPNGVLAATGKVNETLLRNMMEFPYFGRAYPKSADTHTFDPLYAIALDSQKKEKIPKAHLLATFTCLTAFALGRAVRELLPNRPRSVHLTGGGTQNATLIAFIEAVLSPIKVIIGLPVLLGGKAKEAVLFALLAHHHLHGIPGNLPRVTGAKKAVVLGTRFDP